MTSSTPPTTSASTSTCDYFEEDAHFKKKNSQAVEPLQLRGGGGQRYPQPQGLFLKLSSSFFLSFNIDHLE